MCLPVRGSWYFLANPKSIMWHTCCGKAENEKGNTVRSCARNLVRSDACSIRQNEAHLPCASTNQKVVWLHISMDVWPGVHILESVEHLVCQHQDWLQRKLLPTIIEQVFQRGSQEINDQHIVISFRTEPLHRRDAVCKTEKWRGYREEKISWERRVKYQCPDDLQPPCKIL